MPVNIHTEAELHQAARTIIPNHGVILNVPVEVIRRYLVLKQQKKGRLKQAARGDMNQLSCTYTPLGRYWWSVKFTDAVWTRFAMSPCFQPAPVQAPIAEPAPVFTLGAANTEPVPVTTLSDVEGYFGSVRRLIPY